MKQRTVFSMLVSLCFADEPATNILIAAALTAF
jgi:hypothetical protein